ncbi:SMI1/KNR4 family protein [Bacillus cereus group sp. MYBK163-2]|uniref:SMI1/KNR4 family protein n=1 Tax=Bacillus cereus group TaxID=86661 RepID=UPI0007774268|nr:MULTISPECIES: SMI1/KNR4 family protein [Bacillus cereus group]MDA2258350.1 SMI1/KNR4 family protein [Bacillus cereus]MDA2508360.1 SMI1/KNR4 family protein [Bacillus cereus]OPA38856.1 SMI1/KNR4 family protein [Bacillus cereus]TFZ09887.1 SMI1/KNR4 family protein [Bacillus cereus]UUE88346.1 SMI1/KNR4 family protein [Bacillus cereus]
MLRKYYSKNNHLQPFFEEVNKYVDGIHTLNNGINLEDITSLQNELNIQIPDIYKDFVQVCNGGELFIPGTVLSEIHTAAQGPKQRGGSYLNDSFKKERRPTKMPDTYLIIADLNYDDSICIDLESSNGYDATVIQWDRETHSVSRSWNGLVEWLMDTLDEGSLLVDYDGNEKDLDF